MAESMLLEALTNWVEAGVTPDHLVAQVDGTRTRKVCMYPNTPRYLGFDRIVLLDYSRTQLEQAQQRLGKSDKYIYVAADAYRLPFIDGLFDAATMIRTLHHMADAPKALGQVSDVLSSNALCDANVHAIRPSACVAPLASTVTYGAARK